MRRHGLFLVVAHLAAILAMGCAAGQQPNIVLIIADDLGFNDVSFRGSNQIQTPNIDALAYSGVILNRHYVLPTCTPSRTAILTGQYPIRTGMQGYPLMAGEPRGLPLQFSTLPDRLAALGYRTNLVGKWHQGCHRSEYTPTHRGFHHHLGYWNGYMSYFSQRVHMDSPNGLAQGRIGFDLHWDSRPAWEYEGQYATHVFTRRVEEIVSQHDPAAGPLFLQIAHLAAHAGLNGTELEVPDEKANDNANGHIAEVKRRHLAGVIREMDVSVGKVIRALDERGILNNTIIVFMADNGGETQGMHKNSASNWPLRGQKWTVYEGGVRGAAVVWSPKLRDPGTVSKNLMHATDWLPTFYEAAGGNVTDLGELDGKSQWASLTKTGLPARTEVLINVDDASALIQRDSQGYHWKLVRGQQFVQLSGYLGESGREGSPPYDVAAVIKSDAAVALSKYSPALTEEAVDDIRTMAKSGLTSRCRTTGANNFSLACTPFCLFNLDADPCEARDLAASDGDLGRTMLTRLEYWDAFTVPQINQPVDEAANPQNHNMTWVSWMDDPSSSANLTPTTPSSHTGAASTTLITPLPFLLAFLPRIRP